MTENFNIDQKIFDFVYHEALNDATLQGAYYGNKEEIEEIIEAKECIKEYVDKIVRGDKYDFDAVVDKVEVALQKSGIITRQGSNDDPKSVFSFGNIQKLINMTVKYIYIGCYSNKRLRGRFKDCHCPMDNYMLKIVWKEYDKLEVKNEDLLLTLNDGSKKSRSISGVCWSQIGFDSTGDKKSKKIYDNFQRMINELCKAKSKELSRKVSPVEYDYFMWPKKSDI